MRRVSRWSKTIHPSWWRRVSSETMRWLERITAALSLVAYCTQLLVLNRQERHLSNTLLRIISTRCQLMKRSIYRVANKRKRGIWNISMRKMMRPEVFQGVQITRIAWGNLKEEGKALPHFKTSLANRVPLSREAEMLTTMHHHKTPSISIQSWSRLTLLIKRGVQTPSLVTLSSTHRVTQVWVALSKRASAHCTTIFLRAKQLVKMHQSWFNLWKGMLQKRDS